MSAKSFLIQAVLFILPLAAFLAFPAAVVFLTREYIPGKEAVMIQEQSAHDVLVGKAYLSFDLQTKNELFLARMPQITALGNSRAQQFRKEFFKSGVSFFNAAQGGRTDQLQQFLNILPPGNEPGVIIVGLEESYFLDDGKKDTGPAFSFTDRATAQDTDLQYLPILLNVVRSVYTDYSAGKFSMQELWRNRHREDAIGLQAIVNGEGEREDGSHRYGKIIRDPHDPSLEDFEFQETFRRIRKGINLFAQGHDVATSSIEELRVFLTEAARRGIHIVAFLPPYAPTIYARLQKERDAYAYIPKIEPALRRDFETYGFTLFDFSNPATLMASDAEFIDGFHGSEKVYLRLFIEMARQDPILKDYVDINALKNQLKNARSDLEVF